ncbi:MAG: Lipid-A-disaccharide synthase [Limisphaerales bacterium]|nr:MAG: Lipid-A-disaccharide synthase [Limisphaerales bacterium]KAG0509036.1 MAG: Lipid-A-disaccharide synthase [Limisphaerales bacterium]TXT47731.1 MAG: Lipid-A-disaccharide synthase [Limisphaerales bacterium]
MVIAGEPSGDALAAELVQALRAEAGSQPTKSELHFFGAGGPRLAAAGVELAVDMTQHAVIGLWEVIKSYGKFRRIFHELLDLAEQRRPDLLVCVDFSGFNRRFAHALRARAAKSNGQWNPCIVQYVSPQVWASRPGRATKMADDYDLLLSIFPFEKDWYAKRAPDLKVEFVGHPMLDRFAGESSKFKVQSSKSDSDASLVRPEVLLLPGSRAGELKRHLPVMVDAAMQMAAEMDLSFRMVLPNRELVEMALPVCAKELDLKMGWSEEAGELRATGLMKHATAQFQIQVGHLDAALRSATIAVASTGTVTMECALFKVPTVALYKTSWSTYQIGKRIVTVNYLAMPNLLAGEAVFPEFVQDAAMGKNLAEAALDLLRNPSRRAEIEGKLGHVIASLGSPGANVRAAKAVWSLLDSAPAPRG